MNNKMDTVLRGNMYNLQMQLQSDHSKSKNARALKTTPIRSYSK